MDSKSPSRKHKITARLHGLLVAPLEALKPSSQRCRESALLYHDRVADGMAPNKLPSAHHLGVLRSSVLIQGVRQC